MSDDGNIAGENSKEEASSNNEEVHPNISQEQIIENTEGSERPQSTTQKYKLKAWKYINIPIM